MTPKNRNLIGWVLAGILAAVFIMSAGTKLFGGEKSVEMATQMGLSIGTLHVLAIVELMAALLFLIPRTGVLGSMLLAAYLGGAIATHLLGHQPLTVPVILECLLFITAIIRFPEMAYRLFGNPQPAV